MMGRNFPRGKMLINETTINCCKPKRFISFKGTESSNKNERRVRGKRYQQMSDDVLKFRSILKAHSDVQNSGKMRMFKALPQITTILLGTSIALTQPGKLAAKAAAGLGFLALTDIIPAVINKAVDFSSKDKEGEQSTPLTLVGKLAATTAVIGLAAFGLKNTKTFNKISKFVKKEASQLADEINNTKLGKKFNEKLAPKIDKNSSKALIASFGILTGSSLAQIDLADSLSKDIMQKASENYQKGKFIQAQAKAHYDTIDAPEV